MTELSDALQGQADNPPGFSRTLLAAAGTVNHLVFCHQKSWASCVRCKREVRRLQAVIEAVTPVIEEQEREHLEEELRGQCVVAYNEGILAGRASVEKPVGRHAAHEEVEGG